MNCIYYSHTAKHSATIHLLLNELKDMLQEIIVLIMFNLWFGKKIKVKSVCCLFELSEMELKP